MQTKKTKTILGKSSQEDLAEIALHSYSFAVSSTWKRGEVANRKPKLRSYINLKAEYGEQKVRVKSHRSLLVCLRGGTAPLQIETGRYIGLSVGKRICRSCNRGQIEDHEQHFCVECPALEEAIDPPFCIS